MRIELSLGEFHILKDLVESTRGISHQTTIKYDYRTDGWYGTGQVLYNRHEHDGKLQFLINESIQEQER